MNLQFLYTKTEIITKKPELLNTSGDDILKKHVSKSHIKAQKD